MATSFPSSKQTIPNPSSTDLLENATAELDHDYQHATANDTIEALQDKVGADGSAVTTSHDYKLSEVTNTDKAVGKTATQTLTNKTLTSPQINFGSDARGDLIVRNSSGASSRLPVGTSGQILAANASGDPEWIANPAAADASTTVKGVVEIATAAEVTAGTGIGSTGAVLAISPTEVAESGANKILKLNSSGHLPALNGSNLTNVTVSTANKISVVTTDVPVSSTSTETTLVSASIAGGVLSTNNAVRAKLYFSNCSTDNNSRTLTLRLKYGSTTVATAAITGTVFSWNTVGPVLCEAVLLGAGSASAQEGSINFTLTGRNASSAWSGYTDDGFGTATEDSTGALNLVITAQWDNTSSDLTLAHAIIERIF